MSAKPNLRYENKETGEITLLHVKDPWEACDRFEIKFCEPASEESVKRWEESMADKPVEVEVKKKPKATRIRRSK
ncbi:MAG TPA: hypothetical protein VM163_05375 [bacterium]|nr:hypothetical protein [bacterium]